MKRTLLCSSLIALAAACVVTPALAADKEAKPAAKTYATVNGKAIPASRAEVMLSSQMAQGQAKTPELEAAVREELVRREVLAQAAVGKGMDKKADVQAQVDLARQGVLIGAYLNEYARSVKISDEDIKGEYDKLKGAVGDKEYKARHILVDKEDEAKAIVDRLKKGEKFDDLAKASKDPGSKDKGGELGWANQASYVPAFAEAMVKLSKGKFTEAPVQSSFGWHVIQLDDLRDLKAPNFDDVKPQIAQRMRQVAVEKHILDLRGKAKVE
ncbi:MAG: peptidyl-prolyl cis-trans isomerase [Rhodocyclaceae bacterium]|nr:peptidyl-prolyl cis-trans isomerase [Rhodocyclaceae bacterium]